MKISSWIFFCVTNLLFLGACRNTQPKAAQISHALGLEEEHASAEALLPLDALSQKMKTLSSNRELWWWKDLTMMADILKKDLSFGETQAEQAKKFSENLQAYTSKMEDMLSEEELWKKDEDRGAWKAESEEFQPYAKKLELTRDSHIFTFGDFHGDAKTFFAFLRDLREKGVLTGNFELINPDAYLLFLGDYSDRGQYALEIFNTLLELFKKNPRRVFINRGNHEDIDMNRKEFGFIQELNTKFSARDSRRVLELLGKAYQVMPNVIYVGRNENFVQFSHGGLELRYKPADFLNTRGAQFQMINPISFASRSGVERKFNYISPTRLQEISPEQTVYGRNLGFMWNDFQYYPEAETIRVGSRGTAYSRADTVFNLKELGVKGIVRAHQHGDITAADPIMLKLKTHGLFRLWKEDPSEEEEIPVEEGDVIMLNVAVDTPYWSSVANFGLDELDIATYGELLVKENFSDWRMRIHKVKVFEKAPQLDLSLEDFPLLEEDIGVLEEDSGAQATEEEDQPVEIRAPQEGLGSQPHKKRKPSAGELSTPYNPKKK